MAGFSKGARGIPASGRLARWLGVLRWPVVVVWVLAVVLLYPLANGLSKLTNPTASAYLPSSAPSTRVALLRQTARHGRGQIQGEALLSAASSAGPPTRSGPSAGPPTPRRAGGYLQVAVTGDAAIYLLAVMCLVLPSSWNVGLGRFTLPFAAYQLVTLHPQPGLLPPSLSVLVLIGWPAAALLAAALVITRRDA